MVLGRVYQPPQRRPMDLARHHLETIWQENTTRRPAKRWRDDLDKYCSDTIWQRTAQDRLTWRRHAEAFAQPRGTTAAQWWWWWPWSFFHRPINAWNKLSTDCVHASSLNVFKKRINRNSVKPGYTENNMPSLSAPIEGVPWMAIINLC